MMYSQQEYDMVRRQTMQIEAEKRALLRWVLIGVTVLLAGTMLLTAFMYSRYSNAGSRIESAESKARAADARFQEVTRELEAKNRLLAEQAAARAGDDANIQTIVPKMLSKTARDVELAQLAHSIYQQPGHVIALPSIPPDNVLRRYRIRIDGRPHAYILVAGLVDGKWILYSNLVKNQED